MIGRVFRGASPYGLVRYLYGAGRRNEHTNPHLVASWDGDPAGIEPQVIETGNGTVRHDVAGLVDLLEQPVKVCPAAPKQWVYHLVLRNDPGDRRLSDDEWREVCETAMARTGIAPADDPAGCRWVAVRHAEDHIHLVATLAREDGRAPRVWNDFAQLREVAHEFETRYGLRSTAACDDQTAARRPGVKEQVTADAAGRKVAPRVALRRAVKAAAGRSRSFDEFSTLLAADGVTVWPRMSQRDPNQITGYSVSLDDWSNSAGEPVRFGGGKLAPDLSLPKLRARWDPAPGDAARPTANGRDGGHHMRPGAAEASAPPSLDEAEREQVWREAERIVREAAEQIGAHTVTDPAAAADAAWAASDTLAAAAEVLGGDGTEGGESLSGALTRAADELDRAGREQHRRLPARSETGAALRTASRMITVLAAGTRNEGAQVAAVMVALASLAAAVADLRRTQQRAVQSAAADRAAVDLRTHATQFQTAAAATPAPAPPATSSRPRTAADVAAQFGPATGAASMSRRPPSAPDAIDGQLRRAQRRDHDPRGRGR